MIIPGTLVLIPAGVYAQVVAVVGDRLLTQRRVDHPTMPWLQEWFSAAEVVLYDSPATQSSALPALPLGYAHDRGN